MENLENKTNGNVTPTKERAVLTLSPSDAAEYRAYKRQKQIAEISSAISRSGSIISAQDDAQRILEKAIRLRQASVRMTPLRYVDKKSALSAGRVKVDCLIGGDGELLSKVKAYEIKLAKRMGARELTVKIAPSMLTNCRYGEIKRELKKLKRVAKRTCLKVYIDKQYPYATLLKMARICSEIGVQYFCVPYFAGCERLRFDLTGGCELEISEVENLADFKKMKGAGVGRIVTSHAWEIYSEWMREVDTALTPVAEKKPPEPVKTEEKPVLEAKTEEKSKLLPVLRQNDGETNYRCRVEDGKLKFL